MLRLFKAFDAQPRLALVTRTVEMAAVDIVGGVASDGSLFPAIWGGRGGGNGGGSAVVVIAFY